MTFSVNLEKEEEPNIQAWKLSLKSLWDKSWVIKLDMKSFLQDLADL